VIFQLPYRYRGTTTRSILYLGVLLVVWLYYPDIAHAAREVSNKRECATCHIMWLNEFKRSDVTPLVPYEPNPIVDTGKQDVASTERMCFSCHDGFVLDSRFMWRDKKHNHPVGIKPSKKVKIPTSKGKNIFPLNRDGKMYCGTCHSAHGVDWNEKKSPIFLRVKNINSSLCLACHLSKSTGPKEGNHPVSKRVEKRPAKLVHAGALFGAKNQVVCQSCHRAHGGKQKKMLVVANKDSALCRTCHIDKRSIVHSKHDMALMAPESRNIYKQTTAEGGTCSACHVPHNASGANLWARAKLPNEKELDPASALCLGCHNKDGVAKDKVPSQHSHPLGKSVNKLGIQTGKTTWLIAGSGKDSSIDANTKTAPKLISLPLYGKHGHRDSLKGKISCPTCHDPHNWSVREKISPEVDPKSLEGDGNSSFLRVAQGKNSQLCLNCHIKKRAILASRHNAENLSKKDKNGEPAETTTTDNAGDPTHAHHKETGVCASCHSVHYAKGPYLRGREKGPGSLAIETWCRDCHRRDGLAMDKSIGEHNHPLGKRPDKLVSDSKLPFFDHNGVRSKKGTMDCATCHDPHRWSPGANLRNTDVTEETEGDASTSFLRVSASGNSELCAQCHQNNALVKGTDHDMNVTAPDAKNAAGQTVASSGICGQCHAVHDPVMVSNLWGREPFKSGDILEQQCRSCHSKTGIAKLKSPKNARHPGKVYVWSGETRQLSRDQPIPDIPVFDKNGIPQHSGKISCPSCHNPHQWDPSVKKPGDGKKKEGNVMNSFLRNSNSAYIVCADCHGRDGLFRYKYFHGDTSRKKYPLYN